MLIKANDKYVKQLSDLWHEVFGDSHEYIDVFFKEVFPFCETFIKEYDGRVVSALYLLPCNIDFNGKRFFGSYLYAAATKPQYRGKGIMAELINESKAYCKKEEKDFICLVPADDGLYNYYSKFCFQTAMYRYETKVSGFDSSTSSAPKRIESYDEFHRLRNCISINKFIFGKDVMKYVYISMINEGCSFYKNITDGYFISDEDTVYEFFSQADEYELDVKNMLSHFSKKALIYSPCCLSEFGESKAVPFGMIYPINAEFNREWNFKDIYMNLALN